jgi:hypothetical protein
MAYNPNNPNGSATSTASAPVVIAKDQGQIPTLSSTALIMSAPTANTMAASNATVQYTVEAQANYYITLTNGPGATTAWVGTVTFQYSTDNTNWFALTAMPVAIPSASANVTTSTANGLWLIESPAAVGSQQVYIRANMTAYTSGTAYFFVSPQAVGSKIQLPWVYSVTSGATLVGPIEASNLSEILFQASAVTTTVVTFQGTNDPTATTWVSVPIQDINSNSSSGAQSLSTASTFRVQTNGFKFVRGQITTTGTVLTVQGVTALIGAPNSLSGYGNSIAISGGTITTVSSVSTVTTASLAASTSGDIASAAITTTTTSAAVSMTNIQSASFNVAVTAVSGTTPTLDVVVQESLDNVNWYDIYHFERITATGFFVSPTIAINGQQIRYVRNVSGTTPSFTMSLARQTRHVSPPSYRRIFDRTIAPNTLSSVTPTLQCGSANFLQITQSSAAGATVAPVFTLEGSEDNSNWYQVGTTAITITGTASTNSMNYTPPGGILPKFARLRVTTAGTGAVLNYVALTAKG